MSDTTPTPNAAPTPAKPGDKQLYAKNVQHDFIWKLRLTHPDRAEVRLEWKGRPIVIDPVEVLPGDLVLLTSASPDRIRGTAAAVVKGDRPDVIADPAVLEWLKRQGPLGAESASEGVVAGVRFRSMPYTPVPEARPASYFLKASIGAVNRSFQVQVRGSGFHSAGGVALAGSDAVAGAALAGWASVMGGSGRGC